MATGRFCPQTSQRSKVFPKLQEFWNGVTETLFMLQLWFNFNSYSQSGQANVKALPQYLTVQDCSVMSYTDFLVKCKSKLEREAIRFYLKL